MPSFFGELDSFLGSLLSGWQSLFNAVILLAVLLYVPVLALGIVLNWDRIGPIWLEWLRETLPVVGG